MPYVENLLSNYITWFQKIHGNQHCLFRMLENWKSALDQNKTVFALFVAPWCSVVTLNFIQLNPKSGFAQVYRYCSRLVGDLWWWESPTMIPTGNKTFVIQPSQKQFIIFIIIVVIIMDLIIIKFFLQ